MSETKKEEPQKEVLDLKTIKKALRLQNGFVVFLHTGESKLWLKTLMGIDKTARRLFGAAKGGRIALKEMEKHTETLKALRGKTDEAVKTALSYLETNPVKKAT